MPRDIPGWIRARFRLHFAARARGSIRTHLAKFPEARFDKTRPHGSTQRKQTRAGKRFFLTDVLTASRNRHDRRSDIVVCLFALVTRARARAIWRANKFPHDDLGIERNVRDFVANPAAKLFKRERVTLPLSDAARNPISNFSPFLLACTKACTVRGRREGCFELAGNSSPKTLRSHLPPPPHFSAHPPRLFRVLFYCSSFDESRFPYFILISVHSPFVAVGGTPKFLRLYTFANKTPPCREKPDRVALSIPR